MRIGGGLAVLVVTVLSIGMTDAQEAGRPPATEAALAHRSLAASRIHGPAPTIDGRLDDAAWAGAEVAREFVQRRPEPGRLATLATEARVLYDDEALYIGVHLLDPAPGTIVAPYPRRDDETTSDWVFVEIDSRHDHRTAFSFGLNPRGVQVDGVFLNDVNYDAAWNAVWDGAARIGADGWTAEYRIPFSQIVYAPEGTPSADGSVPAVFGLNVYRYTPSRGESSNWSPRLPSLAGIVSNFNDLCLRVPARRGRLEIAPYVSARGTDPSSDPFATSTSGSGGADFRAGLGSSFTLTAAVHPDFGQVEADPSEVNLTTFETLFTERRPLFVEEAGLFGFSLGLPLTTRGNSFAAEQAFYSRRIGRPPRLAAPEGASFRETPDAATLLGAAKLTGRTATGWSVGALGAVTGRETARLVDASGLGGAVKVEPLTEFAVTRVSKDFGSGRSAVGAMATFLGRSGMTPALEALLPSRSLSAGVDARHRFGSDEYEMAGFVMASSVEGTPAALGGILHGPGHYTQRPDATYLGGDPVGTSATGFGAQARVAKIGGEHWRWAMAAHAVSPRLELNDVGFQRNADWIVALGSVSYQQERPGGLFRRWALGSSQIGWGWSFGGERRAAVLNVNANADLRNYWGGSISLDHELPALQIEALRGGPALLMPSRDAAALSLYSDTRRVTQVSLDVSGFREPATRSHQLTLAPALTLRASDRLAVSVGPTIAWTRNAWHYVGSPVASGRTHYLLGDLEQTTASLTARADFAFSPRFTLQLYAQPFASRGLFGDYMEVVAPRAARAADRVRPFPSPLASIDPAAGVLRIDAADGVLSVPDPSYHVRELRANLVLRWEYRPGSALYAVWSQGRSAATPEPFSGPGQELLDAFAARPNNTFLVKVSYWFAPHHAAERP
jgi:Domain of unknown function (DUF5916)/Carbohydrate family 9 binding domain-like